MGAAFDVISVDPLIGWQALNLVLQAEEVARIKDCCVQIEGKVLVAVSNGVEGLDPTVAGHFADGGIVIVIDNQVPLGIGLTIFTMCMWIVDHTHPELVGQGVGLGELAGGQSVLEIIEGFALGLGRLVHTTCSLPAHSVLGAGFAPWFHRADRLQRSRASEANPGCSAQSE